jgi:multicomponent Na+:H+ antiporter subunit B
MNELSKIARTISAMCFPAILVFGFYVILHGHLTPGGGFQGGAVVASGIALIIVAYGSGKVSSWVSENHLSILESIGALGFISVATLGLGVAFFYNFLAGSDLIFGQIPPSGSNPGMLNTGGVLPFMNMAVGMKVIAGLSSILLVMGIASRHFKEGKDKEEKDKEGKNKEGGKKEGKNAR